MIDVLDGFEGPGMPGFSFASFSGPLYWTGLAHRWLGNEEAAHTFADSMLVHARSFPPHEEAATDRFGRHAGHHLYRGLAHALRGEEEPAVREADRALEHLPISKDATSGPEILERAVIVYILANRPDRALDGIEQLLSTPSAFAVSQLRLDPIFDPLREHPRFQALLKRYDVPR